MDQTSDTNQADLEAARVGYREAEAELLTLANRVWADGGAAVDGLLGIAEEHGASEAILRILEAPERFGPVLGHVTDSAFADITDALEERIEHVLVAQERLDAATAKREAVLRAKEPNRLQVVNFGGRAYFIDAKRGELRAVDDPGERYRLPSDVVTRETAISAVAKPSLTETIGKETGIVPAKPGPPRDRTRGR